jgi:hypothetical protein
MGAFADCSVPVHHDAVDAARQVWPRNRLRSNCLSFRLDRKSTIVIRDRLWLRALLRPRKAGKLEDCQQDDDFAGFQQTTPAPRPTSRLWLISDQFCPQPPKPGDPTTSRIIGANVPMPY